MNPACRQPFCIITAGILLFSSCSFISRAQETGLTSSSIVEAMRKACDYQLQQQAAMRITTGGKENNGWIRSAFYTGVMATYETTKEPKYLEAATRWADALNWTPVPPNTRHADNQACGQTYAELYLLQKDPRRIAGMQACFDQQMAAPQPGRVEWWWCDALFMAPPALARLASATGERKYLAFMNDLYWDTHEFLYDKEEHLFYRDADYFAARTKNGKKVFWSRGNGWVVGGLVRVLQYLPKDDPSYPRFLQLFREMLTKLADLQQADGLWRPSLLDPDDFTTSETSGSGFFCYGFAWALNNGMLERRKYVPVAHRAWKGLNAALTPEGRLGYVQKVAGAPGAVDPSDTHEYAVGAFLLAGSEVLRLDNRRFDFGGVTEKGYTAVANETTYTVERGFGWLEGAETLAVRDRKKSDSIRRDFVVGNRPATFRVDLSPGPYTLRMVCADTEHGDHALKVSIAGSADNPLIKPRPGEAATLVLPIQVPKSVNGFLSHLDLQFSTPSKNWTLNALSIDRGEDGGTALLITEKLVVADSATSPTKIKDTWQDIAKWPDPTAPYVTSFLQNQQTAPGFKPTGLTRADYLKVTAGVVDFFKQHQNANGAIIDPYRKEEFQYSTPCFAFAAAELVVNAGRSDLLEPAAKAMDWSVQTLSQRQAASAHEDFFAPQLGHGLPLLKPLVSAERYARWTKQIADFDPWYVYRFAPGRGNWNIVALSGEYLLHKLGVRKDTSFIEESLSGQGDSFSSQFGLYLEGPMAYDHFPRLWAADLIAAGYNLRHSGDIGEVIRRGALTSLFMQSPEGELPLGGRSAHHQWNEAEQCVTYEIYAAQAKAEGKLELAAAFKRAAHLALRSMTRWIRPSGELSIVKNHVDPSNRQGFEGYSAHSQYNTLPMAMLSIAWEHAGATEDIAEKPAPCDVGGYVLQIDPHLHKIFANAGGMYVELDTAADLHYDANGLVRIHKAGMTPQIGPSDTLVTKGYPQMPNQETTISAIGPQWTGIDGQLHRLGEYGKGSGLKASLFGVEAAPGRVGFQVVYQGYLSGPDFVSERYMLTPDQLEIVSEVVGTKNGTSFVWPVLSFDGKTSTTIAGQDKTISVSLDGESSQTFTAVDAQTVNVGERAFPNRNGWARLGRADYPQAGPMRIVIRPQTK
ncbi:MAG: glycoside hydrolase family 88/105 protein [Candidatus Sumerlaeaceae bacterium]